MLSVLAVLSDGEKVLFFIILIGVVIFLNWIYYRNIKKNPIEEIHENLVKARKRLKRADDYLMENIGFGNSDVKALSADGALGLANNSFKKAIDYFNQFSEIHHDIGTSDAEYVELHNKIMDKFDTALKAISYSNESKSRKQIVEVHSEKAKAMLNDWKETIECVRIWNPNQN
jgi:hypothetical protein